MKFQKFTLLAITLLSFKASYGYKYSTNGKCGPKNGYTICPNDECCNKDGKCGFNKSYCGTGCQSEYGFCLPSNYESLTCSSCVECVDCDKNLKNAILCPGTCIKKSSYISKDGKCGPLKICPDNQCCDKYGRCGTTENHCDIRLGCQHSFGNCYRNGYIANNAVAKTTKKSTTKKTTKKTTTKKSSATSKYNVTKDNNCGPDHDYKVCPSGKCCSKYGHCGTSESYCDVEYGCRIGYGKCYEVLNTKKGTTKKVSTKKSTSKSRTVFTTVIARSKSSSSISTDGKCGPDHDNKICPSNKCCSKYGHCGSSEKYCDVSYGCLKKYGRCY